MCFFMEGGKNLFTRSKEKKSAVLLAEQQQMPPQAKGPEHLTKDQLLDHVT